MLNYSSIIVVLLALLGIAIGAFLMVSYGDSEPFMAQIFKPEPNVEFPDNYVIGAWVWKPPVQLSDKEQKDILDFANQEGITTLYVSIDEYIDITEISDSTKREAELNIFKQRLRQFTRQASQQHIKIQALAGGPLWANLSHTYIPKRILAFVVEYNRQSAPEERLEGIQFDIEPYSQEGFTRNKKTQGEILRNYIVLVDALVKDVKKQDSNLILGFAIPIWFDNQTRDLPQISWQGVSKPVGWHVLDVLRGHARSYVVLMDYRNQTETKNGSIAHAADEFAYASTEAPGVGIIIAQEAGSGVPEHTTFHRKGKTALKKAVQRLAEAYRDYPQLRGFAVHDFQSYRTLQE